MRSFIEFYNVREEERLQEIFQALSQGAGAAVRGIGQAVKTGSDFGAGIKGAFQGAQYTPVKRAIDSFKELDEILKELGYDEAVLRGLQDIRARLEQPQLQPQTQPEQPQQSQPQPVAGV